MFLQTPLQQACPEEHLLPQEPQLFESEFKLEHTPEQLVWPGEQTTVQEPETQNWPEEQEDPQLPQFLGSFWRLTQLPLQLVRPEAQDTSHLLLLQICPVAHTLLQTPQ